MWHLSHSSLRFISLIAAFVLVTAWKSDLARTSTGQAHGSDSVAARSKGNSTSTTSRLSSAYGTLPISFEMNQGQTDASVQFLARGAGYILFLTPGEAVLSLHSPHASTAKLGRLATPNPLRPSPSQLSAALLPAKFDCNSSGRTLRLRWKESIHCPAKAITLLVTILRNGTRTCRHMRRSATPMSIRV